MNNEKITGMLNKQINKELFSSYLYLGIANYFEHLNLNGFGHWFEIQAQEELDHAMLIRRFVLNDDGSVVLDAIDMPVIDYNQPQQALAAALEHERMITASISNIYEEALKSRNYNTTQFLDWFIKEQGEEEKNTSDLCKKFAMFGGDSKGLYLLNEELNTRVYAPPSLVL